MASRSCESSAGRALRLGVPNRSRRHHPLDERDIPLTGLPGRETLAAVCELAAVPVRPEVPAPLRGAVAVDDEVVRGHEALRGFKTLFTPRNASFSRRTVVLKPLTS